MLNLGLVGLPANLVGSISLLFGQTTDGLSDEGVNLWRGKIVEAVADGES